MKAFDEAAGLLPPALRREAMALPALVRRQAEEIRRAAEEEAAALRRQAEQHLEEAAEFIVGRVVNH